VNRVRALFSVSDLQLSDGEDVVDSGLLDKLLFLLTGGIQARTYLSYRAISKYPAHQLDEENSVVCVHLGKHWSIADK
jgi:hypothetical protein